MLFKPFFKQNKGFSLVEVLLVVGFIAVASIGVYIIYGKITESRAINSENENVQRIIQETKTVLKSNNSTTIDSKFLSEYGIIEKDKVSANSYQSYLNSNIEFSSLNTGPKTTHLRMVYSKMNQEYCGKIVPLFAQSADFIAVNNNIIKNHLDPDSLKDYNMTEALQNCASAGENFNMIVVFPLTGS